MLGALSRQLCARGERDGWSITHCRTHTRFLDEAEGSRLAILAPSSAELGAALDTLEALRSSGHIGKLLFILPAFRRKRTEVITEESQT